MQEIQDMLNRMDYLAPSPPTAPTNEVDRMNLQKELTSSSPNFNRIADSANYFNGHQAAGRQGRREHTAFKEFTNVAGVVATTATINLDGCWAP